MVVDSVMVLVRCVFNLLIVVLWVLFVRFIRLIVMIVFFGWFCFINIGGRGWVLCIKD